MGKRGHINPVGICAGALLSLMCVCILYVGIIQAGDGVVAFHQTRFTYTALPQSIACRLCTNLPQDAVQDAKSFVYCAPCLRVVRNIAEEPLLLSGEATALREAFPKNEQSISLLVRDLKEKLQAIGEPTAVGRGIACGRLESRDFFVAPAWSTLARINETKLTCEDCQSTVSFKDAQQHATRHLVRCSCGYSPGTDDEYISLAERIKRLETHALQAKSECGYCQQDVGHMDLARHEINCPQREVVCPACHDTMSIDRLTVHVTRLATRDHSSIACPLCENRPSISGFRFANHVAVHHTPHPRTRGFCPFCSHHVWAMGDGDLVGHVTEHHPEEYIRLANWDRGDTLPSESEKALHKVITTGVASPVVEDDRQTVDNVIWAGGCRPKSKHPPDHELGIGALTTSVEKFSLASAEQPPTTYDGQTIWAIHNYDQLRIEAVNGAIPFIDSPPFYLGLRGYKFRLRAYLDGSGSGAKTHLSLYLILMKGEFDALLSFPLEAEVKLKVFNQYDENDYAMSSFKTNPSNEAWKRPRAMDNMAVGVPQLIALEDLEEHSAGYVDDGTLYLGCQVKLREGHLDYVNGPTASWTLSTGRPASPPSPPSTSYPAAQCVLQ